MNVSIKQFAVAFASALALQSAALAADSGKIILHFTGLNNDNGVVRIALFNSKETYSASEFAADQAFKKDTVKITDKQADYIFDSVPFGTYAIKVFHDEDNSGKFVTGNFGIPKVQYGFSNNAHGMFGPAKFPAAKFNFDSVETKMTIKMQGH